MRVLVLEDQPLAAMQLTAALRSLGHEPECVTDGAKGWESLNREPFRVVVSDWRLPVLDGLELCRKVRARGGDYVYFILISAGGVTAEGREEALVAGVDDFLAKPVLPEELRMRLHVAERILGFTVQVQQLASLIPICSYCKKIRDDQKYWQEIESYLCTRVGSNLSHGVCPDCYERIVLSDLKKAGVTQAPPYPHSP